MNAIEVHELRSGDVVVGEYSRRGMELIAREERRGQLGWTVRPAAGEPPLVADWISDWQLSWCAPGLTVDRRAA